MKSLRVGLAVLAIGIVVLLVVANMCVFIVHERDQVVVTRLNRPVHVIVGERSSEEFDNMKSAILQTAARSEEAGVQDAHGLRVSMGAGLYFKMPFVDTVERFPDVLMTYDAEPEDVVLADKKTLVVDNFARWRIENPLLFRVSVRSVVAANNALDDVIYSAVREELGKNNLTEVIRTTNRFIQTGLDEMAAEDSPEALETLNTMRERISQGREKIMNAVTTRADERARSQYGIRVLDVRIKRADLLQENFQAVFGRMQAERSRISKGYRSEGQKEANIIRGETDRQVQVILAEAQRDASKIRGEADAEVIRIYAEAFGSNPDLYSFIRSLEVLKESVPAGSEFIVGADSGLFHLLKKQPS